MTLPSGPEPMDKQYTNNINPVQDYAEKVKVSPTVRMLYPMLSQLLENRDRVSVARAHHHVYVSPEQVLGTLPMQKARSPVS